MQTENRIVIFAPAGRVFALGAAIDAWPRILPHYRWVRVLSDDGRVKQAEMAARRDAFPVRWRTSQVVLPEENRIVFFHTGGVTRGMYVEWTLSPTVVDGRNGVSVTISHDLSFPLPLLTDWFARHVVGGYFVHDIAGRTLARIKEIAESEAGDAAFGK
ncbi:MAG TPA: SRPBCC family protein [Armatimonadaceae bacterium]|jgi:ribosome-associated toxin RatA of RatAB toxin-antitoxin module|nr:SRPBCC family protein [Armatimonadaceae bacterium]